jgi:hypothetical protein
MSTTQADQSITPPSEQLDPFLLLLKEPHCIDFVANIVLDEPKDLTVLRFRICPRILVNFRPDPNGSVKSENLKPSGSLNGYQPYIPQPRRSAKKSILREVLSNRDFHLMVAAPIFPSFTKMFYKCQHGLTCVNAPKLVSLFYSRN